jgi:hypothetical protein
MRVDATGALGLVEHGADDVARKRPFALESRQRFDAPVDLGAHDGGEQVEAFAKQLPLRPHQSRDLGEPMTARVAAAAARPPRVLLGGRLRAALDVVVDGKEVFSHPFTVTTHAPL